MRYNISLRCRLAHYGYVAHDEQTKVGIVIDPVLNFDPASGHTSEDSCAEGSARYFVRRSSIRPQADDRIQRLLQIARSAGSARLSHRSNAFMPESFSTSSMPAAALAAAPATRWGCFLNACADAGDDAVRIRRAQHQTPDIRFKLGNRCCAVVRFEW